MKTAAPYAPTVRRSTRPGFLRGWIKAHSRLAYVVPAALFLGILSVYPLVQLIRMSLSAVTSANLHDSWAFSGVANFIADGQNPVFWQAIENTAIFVVVVTVASLISGFAAAVVLRGTGRFPAFLLGLMVFIWALPPVVNGSVWKFLLGDEGLLNATLQATGLEHTPIPFLYNPTMAIYSVALVNTWAIVPFNALVFRAALMGNSSEVIEAAKLDGASAWQEVRYVFIPTVRPTLLVLVVLTVVYAFRSFDFIYVMTYGGPGTATNTLPFLGYLQAFVQFNYGSGSATALIAALLVVVLAVVYARSIRSEEQDS